MSATNPGRLLTISALRIAKSFVLKRLVPGIFVLSIGMLVVRSLSSPSDSDYFVAPHELTEQNPTTVHQFNGHIKPDTTPVGILIKDVTFSIPRNYLWVLYKPFSYSSVTFTVKTFYPDFAGAKVEFDGGPRTEQSRVWEWIYSPNLVEILGIEDNSPPNKVNQIVFEAEKNDPDQPWKYGLLKSLKRSMKIQDVYFQRPDGDYQGYVVFCGTNELERCAVDISVSPKVLVEYSFHRELLPHWKEIHQKVTSLVQSFIAKKE